MKTIILLLALIAVGCDEKTIPTPPDKVGDDGRFTIKLYMTPGPNVYLLREVETGREWLLTYQGGITEITRNLTLEKPEVKK